MQSFSYLNNFLTAAAAATRRSYLCLLGYVITILLTSASYSMLHMSMAACSTQLAADMSLTAAAVITIQRKGDWWQILQRRARHHSSPLLLLGPRGEAVRRASRKPPYAWTAIGTRSGCLTKVRGARVLLDYSFTMCMSRPVFLETYA